MAKDLGTDRVAQPVDPRVVRAGGARTYRPFLRLVCRMGKSKQWRWDPVAGCVVGGWIMCVRRSELNTKDIVNRGGLVELRKDCYSRS